VSLEVSVPVHTALVGLLWRLLESSAVDPAKVIPSSVFRPGRDVGKRAYISTDDFHALVADALSRTDDEAIGIRAASLIHPGHLGVFGHAWLAGPSLIANFRMLQRYSRAFDETARVEVREAPDAVTVVYLPGTNAPCPDIQADCQVGGLVHFCRLQYGPAFTPAAASLRRREPANRAPWDELFGVPVTFGATENAIRVDTSVANKLLTSSSKELFDQHYETLALTMADLDRPEIVGRARQAIQQLLPSGGVTEAKVAGLVEMTPRTLHRRLSEEGLTFRTLLQNVRMALARRYLGDEQYEVTEIAFMLGYADTSAFSRAFRSWFGTSPSAYRTASAVT
jgi:AraC-like DNA-binding protein